MIKILKLSIIIIVYLLKFFINLNEQLNSNRMNKTILGLDKRETENLAEKLNGLLSNFQIYYQNFF